MKTVGILLSTVIILFVAFKHLGVFEIHAKDSGSCKNTSSVPVESKGSAIDSPELEFDIAENDEQEPEFEDDFDIVDIDEQEIEEGFDIVGNDEYESEMKGRRSFFRR